MNLTKLPAILLAVIAGAVIGAWATVLFRPAPEAGPTVTISPDSLELPTEASTPDATTAFLPGATTKTCLEVPRQLLAPGDPPSSSMPEPTDAEPPGTRTEPRNSDSDPTPATYLPADEAAPYDLAGTDPTGLRTLATSSTPFLYLPLTESGRPTVTQSSDDVTVSAFGQNGRGYTFTYQYSPPTRELYLEVGAGAATPIYALARGEPPDLALEASAYIGYSWRDVALEAGALAVPGDVIRPSIRVAYRPFRWRF